MIYIAKLTKDNFSFLKLGYTKHQTTNKRFAPYRKIFDKVELLRTYKQQRDLEKLEKYLNYHELVKYKLDTGIQFGGKGECYSTDLLGFIEDKIESLMFDPLFDDRDSIALINHIEDHEKMCHGIGLTVHKGQDYREPLNLNKEVKDISVLKQLFLLQDKIGEVLKDVYRGIVFNNCKCWEGILHDTSGKELVVVDSEELEELLRIEQEYLYYNGLLKED